MTKKLTLRMSDDLYDALRERGDKNNRSINGEAITLLGRFIDSVEESRPKYSPSNERNEEDSNKTTTGTA